MFYSVRYRAAARAALIHFSITVVIAILAGLLVFGLWFPGAYQSMAGGSELFLLIILVDTVCGPLLTLVLFNPRKSKYALFLDLGLIVLVQTAALIYGLWTLRDARPLYLSYEIDRFRVVSQSSLRGADTSVLPQALRPQFFKGPQIVGIREAQSNEEMNKIMMDVMSGGADYGERPDFFVPFDPAKAKTLEKSKSVKDFLARYPDQRPIIEKISLSIKQPVDQMRYLPIRSRNNWIAVLTPSGQIAEFVPGDGF